MVMDFYIRLLFAVCISPRKFQLLYNTTLPNTISIYKWRGTVSEIGGNNGKQKHPATKVTYIFTA